MIRRIGNLIHKELIQLRRDWVLTAFIITLPLLQLVLMAQSTSSRIADLNVVVVDHDRTATSRRAVAALDNREELDVRGWATSMGEAEGLLDTGDAVLVVVIPADFETRSIGVVDAPSVQIIADGSNDLVADIALGAAREALGKVAQEMAGSTGRQLAPIDLRTDVRFNPGFDVKLFTVPAQVGFIVYQVTLAVASVGLARERELGTLEQLIVMPLTRLELVVGKAAPALIVGMLNFVAMLAVTAWGFGVPMRGSLWLLLGFMLLFVAAEIGYGIFISGIAHTQQQAILLVFVLAMVDMAFSGFLVPVENLPVVVRWIAELVPLRHCLAVMRNVMLRGAGLRAVWPHAAAVAGVGVAVTVAAVRNLNRRLD